MLKFAYRTKEDFQEVTSEVSVIGNFYSIPDYSYP